jgi:hypothetical protein
MCDLFDHAPLAAGEAEVKKTIAILLVVTGAISIAWPFLPQEWGLWEFMGWVFDASDDPSMGIQYMFFWMVTFLYGLFAVPLGAAMLAKQKPQPTLTDEEREAIEIAAAELDDEYYGTNCKKELAAADTLRSLLKRLS